MHGGDNQELVRMTVNKNAMADKIIDINVFIYFLILRPISNYVVHQD